MSTASSLAQVRAPAQAKVEAAVAIERGRVLYAARCSGCHQADEQSVGPSHRGVVGRRAGAVAAFTDYTRALRESKLLWTRDTLKAWLTDPEALIPGQGMDYTVDDPRDREDLVAYLASLKHSARPAPPR